MRNKVTYGSWVFKDPKISVATIGLEQSLPIRSLGINTFDVEVKCTDKSILQFDQNEPIRFFHRKRQMGIYYVQSIIRVDKALYQISSISTLGLLEQRQYMGGIFTGQTVAEVVADICGNIPFVIKSNLRKIKLYGWIPICSGRDALAQVLFAISANLSTDYNGVLHIETLWSGISSVIPADRIYADSGNDQQDSPVTSVTVLEHQYIPGTERKDLYSGTTLQGQRIPFDEPCHDLQADGFQIIESGANYAVVSGGSGVLTGIPYVHTTTEVTRAVTVAPVANDERIDDATLVSLVNSSSVAERMAEYYKHRRTILADVILDLEVPGQVVQIRHPWDNEMVNMMIDTSSVNVDSILKGSITGLADFTPAQRDDLEYYDERVVLTGTGQWVPPEGVSEVTVVAIGKGAHGHPGEDGTAGENTSLWVTTIDAEKGGSWSSQAGKVGKGGAPGEGGDGGKIYRQILQIAGEDPIAYDTSGDEAVFGNISSASGASSETGYTDPVTGEIYAKKGEPGIAGADGGKGGAAGQNVADIGSDGNPVEGYVGGQGAPAYHSEFEDGGEVMQWRRRGGGGGGGAAHGSNGKAANSVNGGRGASAVDDEQESIPIGQGGHGGHGGGGGGGTAAAYYRTVAGTPVGGHALNMSGGPAGVGSPGTDGGHAGLILYFRRPKATRSGILVDKNYNFLADKFGRLLIV